MQTPNHSVVYRPDALPDAQPIVSKNYRQNSNKLETNIKICHFSSVRSRGRNCQPRLQSSVLAARHNSPLQSHSYQGRRRLQRLRWSESAVSPGDADLGATAERGRESNAVEVLAAGAGVDRGHVEQQEQCDEDADSECQADHHGGQLAALVIHVKCHVRHQRKAEHQTKPEPNDVRVVVDHWQQAGHKHEESDAGQPTHSPAQARRIIRPTVGEDLNEEACKNAKLRPGRTRLQHRTTGKGRTYLTAEELIPVLGRAVSLQMM